MVMGTKRKKVTEQTTLGSQPACVQVLALLLRSCVVLGELFNSPEPQFPPL